MKHLRETFTDQEFADLKKVKEQSGLTWHNFLLISSACFVKLFLLCETDELEKEIYPKDTQ